MKKTLLIFTLLFISWQFSIAQTITGTIIDEEKLPLPGVNVIIDGSNDGTITDLDGNFTLNVKNENATLAISFVGYKTTKVPIKGKTKLNIQMEVDAIGVEEIVVIGYGTMKKSVVTGSIAKIGADDLANSKDLRVEQVLQGRTAGVTIMNNSGQPGDNMTIRIRGTGTNGDPDPLFIIDGLPMEKEGLDYLNPADIQSIEVLKDAASAAIYGTRGANGVVIVTTKQGKKSDRFHISYEGYYGIQNPWKKLDLLDANQYINIINEAALNDGKSQPYFTDEMIDTLRWNTNWQDEMYYYNAPKISHTFSFTGGGEKSTYSSSFSYYSQNGIVGEGKSKFERFTYRLNTSREFGRLKIASNLNFVNINKKGIDGNSQYGTGIGQAINMPPIVPVEYDNGNWGVPSDFAVGIQEITNPVALLNVMNKEEKINKALGNVQAELKIIKGLTFKSNYGTEFSFVTKSEYTPIYFIDATHLNDQYDAATKEIYKYVRWNFDNTLTYEKSIKKHNFVALIGMTRFKEWQENVWAKKQDLVFDDLEHAYLDNAIIPTAEASGTFKEHTLQSYFGRLNYNYDEKYLFEAVLRIDGSSRFGSENKYGKFPAVSAGWVASREAFFPQGDIISFAKLRTSWGQNGNENFDNFKYASIMSNNLIYFFGSDQTMYNGIQPDGIANPSLKWETSQQLDIGIDLTFFAHRLSLTIDYYDKRTKDWLLRAPVPDIVGNKEPFVNGGEVKNYGFELELGFKTKITPDLAFNASFSASTNKSEVLAIENEEKKLQGGEGIKGQGDILRAEVGEPLGYFYGYKTDGIFKTEAELEQYPHQPNAKLGDLKFVDTNKDGTLEDIDRVNIGNPYPKFLMGLNIGVDWRGVDLNMFWYSALGHSIWMANRRADLKYVNFTTDVLDRWNIDNTTSDYPRVTLSDPNDTWKKPSDFYVQKANYLRLKSLTVGYTLPSSITKVIKLSKLRIYISAENLLTITKYPGMAVEAGGNGPFDIGIDHGIYPQAKTLIMGVNIGF